MAGKNTIKVETLRTSRGPFDLTKTFTPGDMIKWVGGSNWAAPVVPGTDEGDTTAAAAFIGVANDQQPINELGTDLPFGQCTIVSRGLVEFTADDNSTYYPGDYVTIGSGIQKVKKTAASSANAIGVVAPENHFDVSGGSNAGIVAVSGTTKLLIALKPQYTLLSTL